MDELWQLVNNQLNGPLGPGAFIVLFAILFVPIFFLIKTLASRSRDSRRISVGEAVADAITRTPTARRSATTVRTSMAVRASTDAPVTTQNSEGSTWAAASTFTPVRNADAVQMPPIQSAEVISGLGSIGRVRPSIFKFAPFFLIALVLGASVLARLGTVPITVYVIALISFAGVVTSISRMRKFGQMMSAGDFNRNVTITINHQGMGVDPTIIKMDADALKRARGLMSAGMNIEAVCREINPAYASWGAIERGLFRKVIEAALKQQGAGGITPPSV